MTLFKSSSFILAECMDKIAKLDNLATTIVVLRWFLISFRQLNDLSDCTDVTGIMHAILRSLVKLIKGLPYLDTKLLNSKFVSK
jgi:hypothetical protein